MWLDQVAEHEVAHDGAEPGRDQRDGHGGGAQLGREQLDPETVKAVEAQGGDDLSDKEEVTGIMHMIPTGKPGHPSRLREHIEMEEDKMDWCFIAGLRCCTSCSNLCQRRIIECWSDKESLILAINRVNVSRTVSSAKSSG